MGEAGVCTSGRILGLCQYVRGCLGSYQPESRHRMQAWVGMFSDVHKELDSHGLLQRNRLSDSLMLPKGEEGAKNVLASDMSF